ncbi:MAG TPA: thiamine-phosphate kinase [Actinomycetota bacterium]
MSFTEDELAETLRKILGGDHPGVRLGPGDDAALVDPSRHLTVLTVDMLVEGVDFERATATPRDVGYKAIAVNVSDVAAMGGSPRFALSAAGFPETTETGWIIELFAGMREAADEYAMAVVGGDLSRADRVVLSVTVTGEVPDGGAVMRTGARPGDRIVVTGALGAAAGGLRLLRAPAQSVAHVIGTPWARELVAAQSRPAARLGEGRTLARHGARAMIDVSDGLTLDLARLCRAGGVGAAITLGVVPVADTVRLLGEVMPVEPLALALEGGEDFELLAALPPDAVEGATKDLHERFGTPLTDIGEFREGSGLVAVGSAGSERPLEPKGWDHFGS